MGVRNVEGTTGALIMETEMCNYELRWKTPYGCPLKLGKNYISWRDRERKKLAQERWPTPDKSGRRNKEERKKPPKPASGSGATRWSSRGSVAIDEDRTWVGFFWACLWKSLFLVFPLHPCCGQ